jgi:AbrB family looped-hinge helix DNA binding protein
MTYTLTVSSQGQIVIPVSVRKIMGLRRGAKVKLRMDQHTAIPTAILEPPFSWADRARGMAKGAYGKGEEYVENERKTWDR